MHKGTKGFNLARVSFGRNSCYCDRAACEMRTGSTHHEGCQQKYTSLHDSIWPVRTSFDPAKLDSAKDVLECGEKKQCKSFL